MIAFNRSIVFVDEPQLDATMIDARTVETINVSKSAAIQTELASMHQGAWLPVSGREARYLGREPFERADRHFSWALEIKDTMLLFWDAERRSIVCSPQKHYRAELLRFWVLHTFLPMVLEIERSCCILHVGAVEVEGRAVLFSAPSFGGKSTLTDYFLKMGHPLLADDTLGIDSQEGNFFAIPSYPYHRPYRESESLGYYTDSFTAYPRRLHSIYVLEKAAPDAKVTIDEIRGIAKFKVLHYSQFIFFDYMKKERLGFCAKMGEAVRVYRVRIPWDKARLGDVYAAIIEWDRFNFPEASG